MAVFPRPARPSVLWKDLRYFLRGDRRYKLLFGAITVAIVSTWITIFIIESWWGVLPEGQQIVYAEDFKASRTDAEIIAQQKIDQAVRDKAMAEKRAAFQRLDKKLDRYGF